MRLRSLHQIEQLQQHLAACAAEHEQQLQAAAASTAAALQKYAELDSEAASIREHSALQTKVTHII
jgi:hypothetical protein